MEARISDNSVAANGGPAKNKLHLHDYRLTVAVKDINYSVRRVKKRPSILLGVALRSIFAFRSGRRRRLQILQDITCSFYPGKLAAVMVMAGYALPPGHLLLGWDAPVWASTSAQRWPPRSWGACRARPGRARRRCSTCLPAERPRGPPRARFGLEG